MGGPGAVMTALRKGFNNYELKSSVQFANAAIRFAPWEAAVRVSQFRLSLFSPPCPPLSRGI